MVVRLYGCTGCNHKPKNRKTIKKYEQRRNHSM